ncbi:MAG TPA: hypothetical protein PLB55_21970 [Prosthecobacter sp.]|nr:hypothetical protein [Prosthecobacter sp.]
MFINSGSLLGIARDALKTALSLSESDRSHVSNHPIVSIVFAAAAGEAFINEIAELCAQPVLDCSSRSAVLSEDLATMLDEVEKSRGSTLLKLLVAMKTLSGKTFDKGANPYQDFATLMDLRNTIMHIKIDRIESVKVNEAKVIHPKIISKLQYHSVLVEFGDESNVCASWFYKVSTPAAARWACTTTANMARAIVEATPAGELRDKLDFFYGQGVWTTHS